MTEILIPVAIILIVLIIIIISFIPIKDWFTAQACGLNINLIRLIAMKIRKVDPRKIVEAAAILKKAGIDNINIDDLEAHYLSGGNLLNIARALTYAKIGNLNVSFSYITAIDLSGNDPVEVVFEYTKPKEFEESNLTYLNKNSEKYKVGYKVTAIRDKDNPRSISLFPVISKYIKKQIEDEIYNTDPGENIDINPLIDKIKTNSSKEIAVIINDLKIYIQKTGLY